MILVTIKLKILQGSSYITVRIGRRELMILTIMSKIIFTQIGLKGEKCKTTQQEEIKAGKDI